MIAWRASLTALAACLVAYPATDAPLSAQSGKPHSLVSLAETPRVQDAQLSPDGRLVSYMLARADWKANRLVPHIWRQPTNGGAAAALTSGDAGESFGRWSPDSRSLLFLTRGDNGQQIFIVAAEGGQPRQLTHHATSVFPGVPPVWSPDGATIYFVAADAPTDAERARDRRDDVYAYDENYKQRHLWRVSVGDGSEQKVTDGSFSIVGLRVSRDGRFLIEHRAPTPLANDDLKTEVWIQEAAKPDVARAITRNEIFEIEAELSPDDTQVLFLAEANARLDNYYSSTLFIVPASGGTPTLLLPDFPYSIDHAAWGEDSGTIFAVVNMGVHSEIFRIDVKARTARALTDGQHSVQFWSAVPAAKRMVFQFDEPTRLGDAWTLDFTGGSPVRATGVYDAWARDFQLPRQEKVTWKGADGAAIEGILYYPLNYQRGRRAPVVVQLHGGPLDSDKFGYGPGVIVNYVPLLAAKGYAVFRPNYRGSAGYGSAFMRDVIGNYFRNMPLDVLAGVDALVAQGVADPDRLAVMGWSAGGHLTNQLLTMTTRFKAAASTAGAANWISLMAESDERDDRAIWFGGLPWGAQASFDAYWNNSPVRNAARIRTPTILMAGEDDARVPFAQSLELYRALVANGVPARLWVAPREGHQWGELRHQIAKANVELEWFERYVTERPYTPERAPADSPNR